MATIEFSPNFNAPTGFNTTFIGATTDYPISAFGTTPNASVLMPAFSSVTGQGIMYLHIMKGSVPTDPNTLTSFSARSADVLVTWQRSGTSGGAGLINGNIANQFSPSVDTANPCRLTTTYQAASASGVATWFWWTTRATSASNGTATDVVYHSIIGTVGTPGSGADMEVINTTITTGKLYRLSNFRIQLPTLITY